MPLLPPEYWEINQQRISLYKENVDRLRLQALSRQAEDVARIRASFDEFFRQASATLPTDSLRAEAVPFLIQDVRQRIDGLADSVEETTAGGMRYHVGLAGDEQRLFMRSFSSTPGVTTIFGQSTRLLDMAMQYSADLIGLSEGGLGARMLADVNKVLRQAVLGLGDQSTNIASISQALGGPEKWTYQAERIYVTEVNRMHSIALEASFEELEELIPLVKVWRWSKVSRKEHQRIDGQRRRMDEMFDVPLRKGGSVKMRHPRDPAAAMYPSAVVNCHCSHYALPLED